MKKKVLLAWAGTAALAASSGFGQIVTRATVAPLSSMASYVSDETTGPNMRFRSGNADVDIGQVFTPATSFVMDSITLRTRDFSLASNPVLRLEFFSVSGSGNPSPLDSTTAKVALTSHSFTSSFSITGSMSSGDYGAMTSGSDQYLTFNLTGVSSGLRSLTSGQQYAFIVGFDTETSNSADRIRWIADGSASYTGGFEVRRDYEFGLGRDSIESAALGRDLEFYVVPEPSTYAALAGALALAVVVCRRRRA